ncbi:MAG: response regulator [Bryobacterales bacterium]|nr:response regulator [Bryobacterales bacterium]
MDRAATILTATLVVAVFAGCGGTKRSAPLPLLSKAQQIRQLSPGEAARGYPVKLRGVVTSYDRTYRLLTVQDATAGVLVDTHYVASDELGYGREIELDGWTGLDSGYPIVVMPRIQVHNWANLPTPRKATLPETASGKLDSQLVEISGVVAHFSRLDLRHVRMGLSSGSQHIEVNVHTEITMNPAILGKEVRVRGVPSTFHDSEGRARRTRLHVGHEQAIINPDISLVNPSKAVEISGSPLTSAREVKQLKAGEVARSLPVQLRGVVNFYAPSFGGLFVQDATSGIYVSLADGERPNLLPGMAVEVRGRTDRGEFAPTVVDARVKILGRGRQFAPLRVLSPDALGVSDENRWASARGTVRRITPGDVYGVRVEMSVAGRPMIFQLAGTGRPETLASWIDGELEVEGVLSPLYDQFRHLLGYRLYSPGRDFVKVIRAAPADPLAGEAAALMSLQQFQYEGASDHRIKVAGSVTRVGRDSSVFISDGEFGLELRGYGGANLEVGDVLEAAGFPSMGGLERGLDGVVLRKTGRRRLERHQEIEAEEALAGGVDSRLVRLEGLLTERESMHGDAILSLAAGKISFLASLSQPQPSARLAGIRKGSILRLTGICVMEWDRSQRPPAVRGFKILLRTAEDVEVIQAASWWTQGNTFSVLGGVATVLLIALVWGFSLRRQVQQQTAVIAARAEHAAQLEAQLAHAQRLESVGRMAGGIAHDFNNLLTVINGYSDLLLGEAGLSGTVRLGLKEIAKAGDRAAALTQQMLAFGRRQMLRPVVLDLNGVVRDVERMLRQVVGERVEFRTELEPALGLVKADSGQIHQVLMNLVVNARDAMPSGGELVIGTANREVAEEFWQDEERIAAGSYVSFSVRDTGMGMDAETMRRIYEPFFTTKPVGEGTGLGLSMVFGIVKQSGGHLQVESVRGEGSTFEVLLPRVQREEAANGKGAAAVTGGSETVLVVEDQAEVRAMVTTALRSAGYGVLEAQDGESALGVFRENPGRVDLLLTDVIMPGMDGGELARQLTGQDAKVRVLFMSGYDDRTLERSDEGSMAAAYIQKPFTPGTLLEQVRAILD